MSSSGKRKSGGAKGGTSAKKKKQQPKKQQSLMAAVFANSNSNQFHKSMHEKYVGTRVLLSAMAVYNRNVPDGEEDYMFQYSVRSVDDCKYGDKAITATLSYDSKCIVEGGDEFQSYPHTDGTADDEMKGYRLSLYDADNEAYNRHLGNSQRKINDKKDLERQTEENRKISAADDCSDIERAITEGILGPDEVMKQEFVPDGELHSHVIEKGPAAGKTKLKQKWRHKHSMYTLMS